MAPFQQGGLDSLCGIYSLVNAEKIINKTKAEDSQKLFDEIVHFLEENKLLASILTGGMLLKKMKLILKEVIGEKIPNKELRFHGKPNPSLGAFWEEVTDFLNESHGRSVIFCLSGVHDHWTTIREITDNQIKLFDSDGLGLLRRAFCTTADSNNKRKHVIWPAQTLFLSK